MFHLHYILSHLEYLFPNLPTPSLICIYRSPHPPHPTTTTQLLHPTSWIENWTSLLKTYPWLFMSIRGSPGLELHDLQWLGFCLESSDTAVITLCSYWLIICLSLSFLSLEGRWVILLDLKKYIYICWGMVSQDLSEIMMYYMATRI